MVQIMRMINKIYAGVQGKTQVRCADKVDVFEVKGKKWYRCGSVIHKGGRRDGKINRGGRCIPHR